MKVGIDSLSFYLPKLHLPITTLAEARNIDPMKLIKGLGLNKMALLDLNQDVITMAANAAYRLLQDNPQVLPQEITKLYVGTESGVDHAKPIASYTLGLLEQVYGQGTFAHCDAVDHTFACIGAVDAMQNAMDFVRANPNEKAMVIATDFAKYDLASSGEYTQGAGAVAILITANPRMLVFSGATGVAMGSVFDFFKPQRSIPKARITGNEENETWFGVTEATIQLQQDQPVFDGQYSNACYVQRITDAYQQFKKKNNRENTIVYEDWKAILMHLPYCYQGRRTFYEIVAQEHPEWLDTTIEDKKEQMKAFSKSIHYTDIIKDKLAPAEIASGEVGNIYTGSIFLGLLSTLTHFAEHNIALAGHSLGFIAYGSGAKAKVFEADVQEDWQKGLPTLSIFEALTTSTAVDFKTYLQLYKRELSTPLLTVKEEFVLDRIEDSLPNLLGARYYSFKV